VKIPSIQNCAEWKEASDMPDGAPSMIVQ
jgi:hypothetical protein